MSYEAVIIDNNNTIQKNICERLNLKLGDKIFLQNEQDGSLRIVKEKKKDIEAIFDQIHRKIKEKGGFESIGLFNEEDVAEMIREQRNA